ncbi:hypothetical protein OAK13_04240 [Candidatus Thioglobus sp.]|nr:hypothetical protein [Candidatus Thioglobus sp.]
MILVITLAIKPRLTKELNMFLFSLIEFLALVVRKRRWCAFCVDDRMNYVILKDNANTIILDDCIFFVVFLPH